MKVFNYIIDHTLTALWAREKSKADAIGDFNTGSNQLDAEGEKSHCADQFLHLAHTTLNDLWRKHNGQQTQEYSWYSRAGHGFRIDHGLADIGATSRCVASYYDTAHAIHLQTIQPLLWSYASNATSRFSVVRNTPK